jgi:hypothetical protein
MKESPLFQQIHSGLSRRNFLVRAAGLAAMTGVTSGGWQAWGQNLKDGGDPIPEPHFPSRLFLFVWRNWELANVDRLADVLGTGQESVLKVGRMMGLPPKVRMTDDQLRRIYITVIRQNWHVLPHEQIVQLLGVSRARYEYILKEDDFLWVKLGLGVKPRCERLTYQEPSADEIERAAEIDRTLRAHLGRSFQQPGEAPFQFIHDLGDTTSIVFGASDDRPGAEELDLSRAVFITPQDANAAMVMADFGRYLRSAFAVSPKTANAEPEGQTPRVHFRIDASAVARPESFKVQCAGDSLVLTASDEMGLRQGVYHLEDRLEERGRPFLRPETSSRTRQIDPRYIYPYFALYGDALMDPSIDPIPEGYLEKLGRKGVNGVWLQAVLRTLAPSPVFPEFGEGADERLRNLQRLAVRAKRHGIRIYLYLNEPRAMPRKFFEAHPEVRGTPYAVSADDATEFAICTSVPKVRQWIHDSLAQVFRTVPDLGGAFAITMSENLTNCFAHGRPQYCPNCSRRKGPEVVNELLETFRDGLRAGNPAARLIAWDWGWGWVQNGADPKETISSLPSGVPLLSVSEWGKKYTRGGSTLSVAEYSISVVGPGANALDHWSVARQHSIPCLAKVQFNNTWEISAVPYIPVPGLIAEHMGNLLHENVEGLMLSWTLGGYPSPNLDVAKEFYYAPQPTPEEALERVAIRRYGTAAAPSILRAWKAFGTAFEEYPYGVVAPYSIPTQHGPSNPLRLTPTGYKAAMILFPYDDLERWLGPYTPEVARSQFAKMAALWEPGLASFRQGVELVPRERAARARQDLGIAETCWIHFRSVANQVRFYDLRGKLGAPGSDRRPLIAEMEVIAKNEAELAARLYTIARQNSLIGYEASNHYYYRPLDLAEKTLNCEYVLRKLKALRA